MNQTRKYQNLFKLGRILLVLLSLVFIIYKLLVVDEIHHLAIDYTRFGQLRSLSLLAFVLVLMFVNLSLEAFKWQLLILRFEPISFRDAFKSIVSGITLSLITPNQVGEFAGRVIHLRVMNKWKGALVSVVGLAAQTVITCILGLLAWQLIELSQSPSWWFVNPLLVLVCVVMFYCYLKMARFEQWLISFQWLARFEPYLNVFKAYSQVELIQIFVLSCIRVCVYTFQYYLLLQFYQVEIEPLKGLQCIAATFWVQAIIPSFFLLDLGLRGASALWFLGQYSGNVAGILLASYSLWIINMLLPALCGLWVIFRIKL